MRAGYAHGLVLPISGAAGSNRGDEHELPDHGIQDRPELVAEKRVWLRSAGLCVLLLSLLFENANQGRT